MRHERDRHAELLLDFGAHAGARTRRRPRCCRGTRRSASARSASCPAPDTPDLASMMIPGSTRPAADERLQRQHRGRRIAPGARDQPRIRQIARGAARSVRRRAARQPTGECGYQRCRNSASRSRKAPERSKTRAPRSARTGAISAARRLRDRQEDGVASHCRVCRHRTAPPARPRSAPAQGLAVASEPLGSHRHPDIGRGMPGQPTQQLDPGIPGGSCDADPDARNNHSSERIVIH